MKISRRRKHSDYFRQVRCSIFDFDLFHSEHLGRASQFDNIISRYEINPVFETSPDFFLTYVDMYLISTQENPMRKHRCFRTRTDVTATMAASGLGSFHRLYLGGAQSRRIGVIPTLWVTQPVLGLGKIHRVGKG